LELPRGQDFAGRLWDVFWMLLVAMKSHPGPTSKVQFAVLVHSRGLRRVHLKSNCGPGDNAEPVITIMLPNEY
jgi:hypothetical protein